MNSLNINGKEYKVINALEYITIPDCFVKSPNKLGKGHGEAKLYVGQDNEKINDFFDDYNRKCIMKKNDLVDYLNYSENEYMFPEQDYNEKNNMAEIFKHNYEIVSTIGKDILEFNIYKSNTKPPRIYINSYSRPYDLIRQICLPNISYISILKLQGDNEIIYYFRPFVDYIGKEENSTIIEKEEEKINNLSNKTPGQKQELIRARVGQGKYREKLLESCPYCPITLVSDERLLIASHIKPWSKSNDFEKTDPLNGFMFTPTYDKLFDRGFITFEIDGTMIVSPWISPMNQKRLNIYTGKKVNLPVSGKEEYLFYHKECIFKG